MISHKSASIGIDFIIVRLDVSLGLGNLEQGCIAVQIPDFESCEIYLVDIVLWRAKIILGDGEVCEDFSGTWQFLSIINNIFIVNYQDLVLVPGII